MQFLDDIGSLGQTIKKLLQLTANVSSPCTANNISVEGLITIAARARTSCNILTLNLAILIGSSKEV